MKLKIIIILSTLTMFFLMFAPKLVLAEDPLQTVCDANPSSSVCQSSTTANPIFGPDGVITKITKIIGWLVGVAAVIMIIINGLRFILSNGNAEKVATARNGIIYAAIGLVVALLAQAIALFVLQRL